MTTDIEAIAACGARIAELEAEQSLHDAELDAGTARAERAEAERDAAWELVEELDPHHLRRNQMGMRRPREGGGG